MKTRTKIEGEKKLDSVEGMFMAFGELVLQIDQHGDWDEGCFYYNKHYAPELESVLLAAHEALQRYTNEHPLIEKEDADEV